MNRFVSGAAAPLGLLLAAMFVLLPPRETAAVVTASWSLASYKDWNEGEADGALISSAGEVMPGWTTKRIDLEIDGIWAALRTRDGSVILGTDSNGALYRVRGDKVSQFGAIPDVVAVVSLAQGRDGAIYAGTMPGGQIWRVDGKSGKARKLTQLADAETVWSLTFDKAGTTLYAGTGGEGNLHAVDIRTGRAKLVFASEDKRILSLTTSSDGSIWFGTSDEALIYRHEPKSGKTRAMADFAGNEVSALAPFSDGVIAVANDFDEPSTTGFKSKAAIDKARKKKKAGAKAEMPKEGTVPGADGAAASADAPKKKGTRKGKGALYRVYSDGRLEQLHALTSTYFSDVVTAEDGRIFAGAGDLGRVYLIDTDDNISTAFDVEERIVAALLYDRKQGLSFATSDAAAMYRSTGRANAATYTSKVYDTDSPARFGRFIWHGEGNLRIETRSGNIAEPGKGWSAFSALKNVSAGGGGTRSGQIASPTGRYVQFRVSFPGGNDVVLRGAELFYLPHNAATKVQTVTMEGGGASAGDTLRSGAIKPHNPVRTIKWSVKNPDKDKTEYTIEVRRQGEALWRALRQRPTTSTSFEWNTETFPDGRYRVRIMASDRRSNAPGRERQHAKVSELVVVDNARPRISELQVRYPRVTGKVVDGLSIITEIAFAIDDGDWHVGTTDDGILDSETERLRLRLPADLAPGVHTLAIRVMDQAGNLGVASTSFRIRP